MTQPAPDAIGGATVIAYSPIDQRHRPTGGCRQMVAGVLQPPATGLAICQYKDESAFYLFGCDENWQIKTDTWHPTIEEAMTQAEFEYEGVRQTWVNHRPAWEPMTDDEMNAIWGMFYERFRFRPSVESSDWPSIHEPAASVTHDISHAFSDGGVASTSDEIDLNVEMLGLFRQLVLPGERLCALDWHHDCYWFNPYSRFGFSSTYTGMISAIPDGDYSIFLADDFRVGIFGHPWEQTICVWGQPLLEVVARHNPKLLGRVIRRNGHVVG